MRLAKKQKANELIFFKDIDGGEKFNFLIQ